MKFNWTPFISIGAVLTLAVLVMIIWRKTIASHEDDSIHVLDDANLIPQQEAMARKLQVIDKWGKLLTAVTAVYLLAMAAIYFYQLFEAGSTAGM
jgi:hypothetical protein